MRFGVGEGNSQQVSQPATRAGVPIDSTGLLDKCQQEGMDAQMRCKLV